MMNLIEIVTDHPYLASAVGAAAVIGVSLLLLKTPILRALSARVPKLWLVVKCLGLGYIAGSIHAPFGIEWRTTSGLPEYERILPTLPTEPMNIDEIDDALPKGD